MIFTSKTLKSQAEIKRLFSRTVLQERNIALFDALLSAAYHVYRRVCLRSLQAGGGNPSERLLNDVVS